ncbi:GSCOCG00002802001-RA-CDS [Cotesia congregata]|nr:GSCOCG00002802001-RA-CDS [Cotesia congregata]
MLLHRNTNWRRQSLLLDQQSAGELLRNSPGGYFCRKCGNSYSRLHSLNRHIKFECGVEPQFECPLCHKRSKHKHNLLLHMRTHQKR